jgi:hypothetical protein
VTAPKTSPAMSPEQQGRGGEQSGRVERVGLVMPATDREQGLGTCSPERHIDASLLFLALHAIQDASVTAVEKEAVERCLRAVRKLQGREEDE